MPLSSTCKLPSHPPHGSHHRCHSSNHKAGRNQSVVVGRCYRQSLLDSKVSFTSSLVDHHLSIARRIEIDFGRWSRLDWTCCSQGRFVLQACKHNELPLQRAMLTGENPTCRRLRLSSQLTYSKMGSGNTVPPEQRPCGWKPSPNCAMLPGTNRP